MTAKLKIFWTSIGIAALLLAALLFGHGQTANVGTVNVGTLQVSGTPDTSTIWTSTNWLQFGTNLNTGTTATNDMSVTVSNAGTGTLTGTATTLSPFSVIGTTSYAISGTYTTNITVRYTRSGEQNDTNELTLTGGGGTQVHLSGRSTNAPAGGAPGVAYSTNISNAADQDSLSVSVPVTGANRLLLVSALQGAGHPTSANFSGQACTSLCYTNWYAGDTTNRVYYLYAPNTGTSNVTVNFAGAYEVAVSVLLITNAHQSSAFGSNALAYLSSDATNITTTVISGSDKLVVSFCAHANLPEPISPLTALKVVDGAGLGIISSASAPGASTVESTWYRASFDRFTSISLSISAP